MSKRSLLILCLLTTVMVVAAWLITTARAPSTEVSKPALFPSLLDRVNDVARIEVASAGDRVVLIRDGDHWLVENRDGYPAILETVKRTVVSFARLKVLESKTRRPELYARLGVEDVESEGSTSRRITLADARGNVLAALIAGRERKGSGTASADKALYVREVGAVQALLVEGDLQMTARPADWMDTMILNVDPNRIYHYTIAHPGTPPIEVRRQSRDVKDYALTSAPAGTTARSLALLTSQATALNELRFEDVAKAGSITLPDDATVATYRTFDGLVVEAHIATIDGRSWCALTARYDPEAVYLPPTPPAAGADGQGAAGAPAGNGDKVRTEAAELQQRLSQWVYALPEFKASMMTKTLDALIKPADAPPPGAAPAASEPAP